MPISFPTPSEVGQTMDLNAALSPATKTPANPILEALRSRKVADPEAYDEVAYETTLILRSGKTLPRVIVWDFSVDETILDFFDQADKGRRGLILISEIIGVVGLDN